MLRIISENNVSKPDENETVNQNRAPRRGRPSVRESGGRSRRIPLGVAELKLEVPEAANDPDHVYRWINDKPGRLQRAIAGGWEYVEDHAMQIGTGSTTRNSEQDSRISQIVGKNENGFPLYAYLMRIKREWYDEDQSVKQAAIDEVQKTIERGQFERQADDMRYIPDEGIGINVQ